MEGQMRRPHHCRPDDASVGGAASALSQLTMPSNVAVVSANTENVTKSISLNLSDDIKHRFMLRPGFGQDGKQLMLKTNFFPIKLDDYDPDTPPFAYHYDIDLSRVTRDDPASGDAAPRFDPSQKRFKKLFQKLYIAVVQEAVKNYSQPGDYFNGITPVFDGARNLYTSKLIQKIQENPLDNHRLFVELDINGKVEKYAFSIKLASKINMHKLKLYFDGEYTEPPHDCLQVLDIILRYGPTSVGTPINNAIYIPEAEDSGRQTIGRGQQLAFGFFQAVHAINSGPGLVVNRTTALFHEAGPVIDYIAKILEERPEKFKPDHFKGHKLYQVVNALKNLEVKVNHLTYRRKYKIRNITDKAAREIVIDYMEPDENGVPVFRAKMAIPDFYQKVYQKTLKYAHYPCIETGSKDRPNYLPIELCEIVADQPVKIMSSVATAEMIRTSARQLPQERIQLIEKSMQKSKEEGKCYLTEFGVKIRNQPIRVPGRVLDPPTLEYQNGTVQPQGGKWDMKTGKKLAKPVTLGSNEWAVISFSKFRDADPEAVARQLYLKGKAIGMDFGKPLLKKGVNYQQSKLKQFFRSLYEESGGKLKLIVCIVYQSNDLYREIKLIGDCVAKIATQCIHEKKIRKITDELYITNVLLKINGKVGGSSYNFSLIPSLPEVFKTKKVMTVGIDFTHPAPGEKLGTSICGCVASADSSQSQWFSSVRINRGNAQVDLVTQLDEMMTAIYVAYVKKNGSFPEVVIVYRDGISESQFANVDKKEMKGFERAFEMAKHILEDEGLGAKLSKEQPKLTIVIVQKSHGTRFVPFIPSMSPKAIHQNVPPGTVIDVDITHPVDFDFYMTSHEGLQGTSRPTHYYVLRDENKFSADDLQQITYDLCYCFVRCMRSISAPAPVAYANLLAARARHHFNASMMDEIRDNFTLGDFLKQDRLINKLYFI